MPSRWLKQAWFIIFCHLNLLLLWVKKVNNCKLTLLCDGTGQGWDLDLPSSSPALASLGRAGCPLGGCISLCSSMSFHSLIYSVNKELSQQWPSYSGVCWSQSDSQPPWTHWFYSLGGCSDQTYTLCRRWCLQSAVNSNKAKPDLRGHLNGKHERPHY